MLESDAAIAPAWDLPHSFDFGGREIRYGWFPLERGRELARRIPNAGFRSVSAAKHLVQEDAPEAIVATVLEFLSRLSP
jgi:pimeloyl-ACP methyl ester carboxylesterase